MGIINPGEDGLGMCDGQRVIHEVFISGSAQEVDSIGSSIAGCFFLKK